MIMFMVHGTHYLYLHVLISSAAVLIAFISECKNMTGNNTKESVKSFSKAFQPTKSRPKQPNINFGSHPNPMFNYNCNITAGPMKSPLAWGPKNQSEEQSYSFAPPMPHLTLTPVQMGQPAKYYNPNCQWGTDMLLPPVMSAHQYPISNMSEFSDPMSYGEAPKTVKYLVIFDWDDTLFPTTAITSNGGKGINVRDLLNLGKSVYELLEEYIARFGAKNLFIVTNAKKSWFLRSLKMVSDICKAYFEETNEEMEQKESNLHYWALIYNDFSSSHSIPVFSAQDEFAHRFPQVTCTVTNEPNALCSLK